MSAQSQLSPDGRWIAEFTFEQPPNSEYHLLFKVYQLDGTVSWTLQDVASNGLGYSYPGLHRWSYDSRYFYFSWNFAVEGSCESFAGRGRWVRVDVRNGKVTELPWPVGVEHSLAPDENMIAYIRPGQPLRLVFYNLDTKASRSVALTPQVATSGTPAAGNIVWSPDGSGVALSITSGDMCGGIAPVFSILRVDIATLKLTTLVADDQWLLTVAQWPASGEILLREWNGYSWWIDSVTGETTSAPAS